MITARPIKIRVLVSLLLVFTLLAVSLNFGLATQKAEAAANAAPYTINWTAADPKPNNAPFMPTYNKVQAAPCPPGGVAQDLTTGMANAVFGDPRDSVESLMPYDMILGQIVPYEVKITVGSGALANSAIEFTSYWLTKTTSGKDFGFDPDQKVICAFVDTGDAATNDQNNNAKVDSFPSGVVKAGTSNEQIQGVTHVSGLDPGDTVVVEIWVVLKNKIPNGTTGNVQTGLLSAKTASGDTINTGNQTVSLIQVQDFFSANIVIVKNTLTVTDTFGFTGLGYNGLPATFSINPTTPKTFISPDTETSAPGFTGSVAYKVAPGTYTITESTLPKDWFLYGSSDSPDQAAIVKGQPSVTVSVKTGGTTTVYFYNQKQGPPNWPVPEASTIVLLGAGLLGIGGFILYRRHKFAANRTKN